MAIMGTKTRNTSSGRAYATGVGFPLAGLVVAATLLLLTITTVQAASHDPVPPTATQIEKFLRKAMANEHPRMPTAFWTATLMNFELRRLERITQSRWIVVTELLFDFGPPPPAVLGFERQRRGHFRLVLDRENGRLKLNRFAPMGLLHPLPKI